MYIARHGRSSNAISGACRGRADESVCLVRRPGGRRPESRELAYVYAVALYGAAQPTETVGVLEGRPREGARQVTSTMRAVLVLPKQEIHSKGYMVEAVMSMAPVAAQ
jgi:hypothetical protein